MSAVLLGKDMPDVSLEKVFSDQDEAFYKLTIEHGDKLDATI